MSNANYLPEREAKGLICKIGSLMYQRGFVAANDGNITIRVSDTDIWVTPANLSKAFLNPESLVKVDIGGRILEGSSEPTSELSMHLRVYNENPEVVSTCHSHSPYALAFACAGIEPDLALTPGAMVIVGPVHIAPFAFPGTVALADSIAPYCKDHHVVLLANHGSLSWGESPLAAWYRMEALEAYCQLTCIVTGMWREPRLLGQDQIDVIMENPKYGVASLGRHIGVPASMNSGPGIPLSSIFMPKSKGPGEE
jgi:L-fuculose-phosphate aldolase